MTVAISSLFMVLSKVSWRILWSASNLHAKPFMCLGFQVEVSVV